MAICQPECRLFKSGPRDHLILLTEPVLPGTEWGTQIQETCNILGSMFRVPEVMAAGIVLVFISNMVYSTLARTMSKPEIEKEFLSLLLRKGGLRIAPNSQELFVFKSGRRSPNFINTGALTDGESLAKVKWAFGNFIANLLSEGKL